MPTEVIILSYFLWSKKQMLVENEYQPRSFEELLFIL